jgi:hypothetical protein
MTRQLVDILSDQPNVVVLRTPGRNYPGLVFQGDTLRGLLRYLERMKALTQHGVSEELCDEIDDMHERLRADVSHYERVLDENSMSLPYPDRVTPGS